MRFATTLGTPALDQLEDRALRCIAFAYVSSATRNYLVLH